MLSQTEKQTLKQSINDLGRELMQQAQDAHGFFTTKTRHAVSYSDLATRQDVQNKLDHAVALLAIANLMAVFEDHLPKKYWTKVLHDSAVTMRLKAYRHIRFSAISGFTGSRAKYNKSDFDKVMASSSPLRGVRSYDNCSVFLDEQAASIAFAFVNQIYSQAIVKIHHI